MKGCCLIFLSLYRLDVGMDEFRSLWDWGSHGWDGATMVRWLYVFARVISR